jgi:hypothetical protein
VNTDLTAVLRLTDVRGRALLMFYGAGTTLVAGLNLERLIVPAFGILSLLVLWGALLLLSRAGATPFALRNTLAVLACVVSMALLSAWNLVDVVTPGYSGWYLGAATFVLLVLGLRGRGRFAWTGFILIGVISLLSTLETGQLLFAAIAELARQAGTLFIGSLFAIVLRRAARVIATIQERQLARVAIDAATTMATRERSRQNERLEEHARPALERLLSDEPLSGKERQGMALLEAELRDGIRAAGFVSDAIVAETRAARERGVQVILVDDRGGHLDSGDFDRVENALVAELQSATAGTVTARLSTSDSIEIATIVVGNGDSYRSVSVGRDRVDVTQLSGQG